VNIINKKWPVITKKQCTEFGQVSALVTIFCFLRFKNDHFIDAALVLMLITILIPIIFYPFAMLWFGLAELLSVASPAIILTILFFLVVTPVGLFRRLLGKDSLRLKQFKKGRSSVMIDKDHLYTETDLSHIF
jgi:hypothetical protein